MNSVTAGMRANSEPMTILTLLRLPFSFPLPGRRTGSAVEAHRAACAGAVAAVTRSPVRSGGGYREGEPFVVLLGDGNPVDLMGDVGLSLAATEQVRVRRY